MMSIAGRNVLIVEDEYWLAEEMATTVRSYGGHVLGPYDDMNVREPLHEIDVAILDINLGYREALGHNEHVFPLAFALHEALIPFIFVTGYQAHSEIIPTKLRHVRLLTKPVPKLCEVIKTLLQAEEAYYEYDIQQITDSLLKENAA